MKRVSGFTLIELLVVVSIIGLLSSVILAGLTNARDKGKLAAGMTTSNSIYSSYGLDAEVFFDFNDTISFGDYTIDRTNKWKGKFSDTSIGVVTDTPTRTGYAISLNGSSLHYLQIRGVLTNTWDPFLVSNKTTLAAWIKSGATSKQTIFSNQPSGRVFFGIDTAGKLLVNYMSPFSNMSSNTAINDNKWHFVVWTTDSATSAMYIDGKLDKTATQTTSSVSGAATIGIDTNSGGDRFIGLIDDFAVYNNRTLLASEVEEMYLASLPQHLSVVE